MEDVGRKFLPHALPLWIDPSREVFFLTICSAKRGNIYFLSCAQRLLDSIRAYHDRGRWWVHLAVIMPDHLHLLVGIPAEQTLESTVRAWKHWTSRNLDVIWQRDFFDHRIRTEAAMREKADYVLQNPVRAGLVSEWKEWPHVWTGGELTTPSR